jgi:hypothetical protein
LAVLLLNSTQVKIQEGIETYETDLSIMYFDNDGIFHSKTKKGSVLNKEALELTFKYIRKHTGDKKICWIGDITEAPPPEKTARDFAAQETPKLIMALALITNSSLSKMIAEIFLLVKKPPYPTKFFKTEEEGLAWLKTFL